MINDRCKFRKKSGNYKPKKKNLLTNYPGMACCKKD